MPPLLRAVEICLQFPYRRTNRGDDEWYWVWRSNVANLSARVYPDAARGVITVAVFDEETNESIREWSRELRLTGNWRRRLRRSAGEAMSLAQRRPYCLHCRLPMALKECHDGSRQFFGCRNFPDCRASAGISDHDLERKSAAGAP